MVSFPLLLIPLAIYNIVVWLMPGVSFTDPLLRLTLVSGADWPVTLSDILLAVSVLLLLLEVIKIARTGTKYLTDHLLSFVVFGVAAAEFVLWPKFATSTYFLLTLLALVEFLSGITLHTRRAAPVTASGRAARRVEPAPAPVPTTVAIDQGEPKPAAEPGPTVTSPDLQPSSGASTPSANPDVRWSAASRGRHCRSCADARRKPIARPQTMRAAVRRFAAHARRSRSVA